MQGLSEIARRAGVSVATVSLALRGRGGVARKTVERVKAVAEEVGYRPNPLLSSLASKKFRSVDVVAGTPVAIFTLPVNQGKDWPRFYNEALEKWAKELGYAPTFYRIDSSARPDVIYRELYHRMAQGIVVLGGLEENRFYTSFDWAQFCVVQCGRFFGFQPFHIVRPNIYQAVKMVFQELQALGYRRIGYAAGRHPQHMEDDDARFGAAVAMEVSLLRAKDRVPVFTGQHSDAEALVKWVKRHNPEVVIGFSPAVFWVLRDAGFDIPGDLGFASMHSQEEAPESRVTCSGALQNQDEIARQSILLLDQLIRNRERGTPVQCLDVLVRSTWLPGNTLVAK